MTSLSVYILLKAYEKSGMKPTPIKHISDHFNVGKEAVRLSEELASFGLIDITKAKDNDYKTKCIAITDKGMVIARKITEAAISIISTS